ncbi:unnamed protein product [Soboliphyme baturini]|uniref:Amastin surface glycofamily protein n=1 Tax=Soboliphyme baturini TaxID=241478 RepID=A0A183IPM7_9BILA|nr:unnamed protein product [Soboliphyme baturini]
MCSTFLTFIYVAGTLTAAILQVASLVTQSWFVGDEQLSVGTAKRLYGLFFSCTTQNVTENQCILIWNRLSSQEKAAAVCFILAVAFSALSFIWGCVNCFACCCRSCLTMPLAILAGIGFVLNFTGACLMASSQGISISEFVNEAKEQSFGLSMWICVASVAVTLVNTVVGIILALASKVCPC